MCDGFCVTVTYIIGPPRAFGGSLWGFRTCPRPRRSRTLDGTMFDDDARADVEGDADLIYRLAHGDPDDVLSPRVLCEQLLDTRPRYAPIAQEATIARVGNEWRVYVARGTSPARARWLVGHELAEWWYQQRGYRGEDLEARCDALGAALVLPRRVLQAARRQHGDDVHAIARALRVTQSLALLRVGEVTGTPSAVIRQAGAIVRGEAYVWPVPLMLTAPDDHPGIRKVEIDDEPTRKGLVAG